MSKKFFLIIFALCLFTSLTFYLDSLNYYFFQDDFFEINISKASNLQDYLGFFKFRDDIIAYRPISLQNYFFLSSSFFDLNSTGFRLIAFIIFLLNAFLIAKVISKITKNQNIGLLTASLWITSSIHFMTLSWIAAAYNITGTFFFLLTSLIFLNFLKTKKFILYALSFILFILTIGSFEFSITWPIIFGFYYLYVLGNPLSKTIKLFLPFVALSVIYLYLRLLLIKIPPISEYQTTFNLDSAKALFWYFLWTFNIPEEFKKQIVNNLIFFNPKFAAEYWPLITKTFLGAILVITLGIIVPLIKSAESKLNLNFNLLIFSCVWFFVAISPVLILPNHTFSMYLTLASIGLYLLVSYLVNLYGGKILSLAIITVFIYTAFTTLSFYKINSWMIEAQQFAREFSLDIKKQYPDLPTNSIVYFPHQNQRHSQALLDHHAIRTIYNDQTLAIYYNKESLIKALKSNPNHPVYIYFPE